MKVVFATPSLEGPMRPYLDSLEASLPLIQEAGWDEEYAQKVGSPYISHARSYLTRKALDAGADVIVYLDYDLSWDPKDLLTLLDTEGDVVAGLYRFKKRDEEYMGTIKCHADGTPLVRASDGSILGDRVPAGFLKVTRDGIAKFMRAYPELIYGDPINPSVDLFNHGAWKGVWWGEDYAFSRRWQEAGEEVWVVPDLNLTHHAKDTAYPGNFHQFMLRQPQPEAA